MTRHGKPKRMPRLRIPSLYTLLGCTNGRIWWFKVAYITGDPLDE